MVRQARTSTAPVRTGMLLTVAEHRIQRAAASIVMGSGFLTAAPGGVAVAAVIQGAVDAV